MSATRYIFVRCHGRMANVLLSWANARYVTRDLKDYRLLIDYPPIRNQCTLPLTDNLKLDTSGWPKLHTPTMTICPSDCVWVDGWSDFPWDKTIKQYMDEITYAPAINEALNQFTQAHRYIGVHVRYGDYVAIDPSHPPAVMPTFVRAPCDYYISRIDACLKRFPGHEIFLATNGTPDELLWFHQRYPNALKHTPDNPLLDLLTLSKAEIIVGSSSTFSSLACLMSGKPLIHPAINQAETEQILSKLP